MEMCNVRLEKQLEIINGLTETHGKFFRSLNLFLSINYSVSGIQNEKASLSFFLDSETS